MCLRYTAMQFNVNSLLIFHKRKIYGVTVHLLILATLLFRLTSSSLCTSQTYNIIPSTNIQHLTQHCFTLEQFANANCYEKADSNNLVFQPGNHSLYSVLVIANLEYLSLSTSLDTMETWIICHGSSRIILANISNVEMSNIKFLGCGGTMATDMRNITVHNCTYHSRNGSATVLEFNRTTAIIRVSSFHVINTDDSSTNVTEAALLASHASTVVIEASALVIEQGSAILAESESHIHIISTSFSNSTTYEAQFSSPPALIQLSGGTLTIEKSNITHNMGKKIIYARECVINISSSSLDNNSGKHCILCLVKSKVYLTDTKISENCGDFSIIYLLKTGTNLTGKITFSNNNGAFLIMNSRVVFLGMTLFENCTQTYNISDKSRLKVQGTLTAIQSTIQISGNATFRDNYSTGSGAAIYASECKVSIYKYLLVNKNEAKNSGGGAFLYLTNLVCHGNCTFSDNRAYSKGGGIHAVATVITLSNSTQEIHFGSISLNFIDNRATKYGGGLYYEVSSKLSCIVDGVNKYKIAFTGNTAGTNGGAIFVNDATYSGTCNSTSPYLHWTRTECFFHILYNDVSIRRNEKKHSITFANNTAVSGSVLYGGLLDRCTVSPMADIYNKSIYSRVNNILNGFDYLHKESKGNLAIDDIASDVVRIRCCPENCTQKPTLYVLKGEIFNVAVVAYDQVNHTINTTVRSSLLEENTLGEGQQLQRINGNCTNLTYKITSPHDSVDLVLYADQSPCKDKGLSPYSINIKFDTCSCQIGFLRSEATDKCECHVDPRLDPYIKVLNSTSFMRTKNVWINYTTSGSGHMYFIHPNCPYDYCLPLSSTNETINLNEPNGADAQCNFNRSGLLCGQCKQGYSLSMGSSHCLQCPKHWPGLVVANVLLGTVLGMVLVVLLLVLNLTVASGTVNGIIFYANVVLMNRSVFVPSSKFNFLALFVFSLNTQIGMKRCFFEGMTAYAKAWYSFVFPLYMISLVIAIIVVSEYSPRCARLIGKRNPVATLATLILLSYACLLRTVLDIFSFAILKYPDGTHDIVWLPDANLRYFQGKHTALLLPATVIISIGLIYTVLLFSWQWLLRAPNIRMFRWVRNTKLSSFMDAYHAPYRPKYRYWTGLLLLVRVVLSIAITINVSGNPKYNLLTTGILIASLVILKAYLSDRIYRNNILDYFDSTCYFNLLLLTLVTFYFLGNHKNQKTAARTSFAVTFVITLCVLLYHIHCTLSKTMWYKRLCNFVIEKVRKKQTDTNDDLSSMLDDEVRYRCISTVVALSHSTDTSGQDSYQNRQHEIQFTTKKPPAIETSGSNSLRESLLMDL